jgi:hypothetical protein
MDEIKHLLNRYRHPSGILLLGLLAMTLPACSGSDSTPSSRGSGGGYYAAADVTDEDEEREPFDEDAAREAAEEEIGSDTYAGIGMPYGCTDDCSGHEAGFAWRRDNGYVTSGNSDSFREGAQAFEDAVDERVEEMEAEYEDGEEPYKD